MAAACNFTIPADFCTLSTCCVEEQGSVHYRPSIAGNLIYGAILLFILLVQLSYGIKYKTWGFLAGMFVGLALEVCGYIGRLWIHGSPFAQDPFLMYLICLTIGPAFLSASIYLSLGRVVIAYGQNLSRFTPRVYTLTFISCDLISLILQALGGAIASIAKTKKSNDLGVHIMVAGLIFQVFSLALFMAFGTDFARSVRKSSSAERNISFTGLRSTPRFRGLLYAIAISTISIFIRSVYRVAELEGGFDGKIAKNELAFMVFEGPMIIIATGVLTIFHPGSCFAGRWNDAVWSLRKKYSGAMPLQKLNSSSTALAHDTEWQGKR